jgi:predicted house-cleaning noncanonical NTP pyrophosphatase (MazG superfamily)
MARKVFRKLVRDYIPDIIRNNGDIPVTKKLSVKEYKKELLNKLREEVEEVVGAKKREDLISELADVQEVLTALYEVHRIECSEVTETARKKRKTRGAFTKKIFLIETR